MNIDEAIKELEQLVLKGAVVWGTKGATAVKLAIETLKCIRKSQGKDIVKHIEEAQLLKEKAEMIVELARVFDLGDRDTFWQDFTDKWLRREVKE